jgi:hypothetical protein
MTSDQALFMAFGAVAAGAVTVTLAAVAFLVDRLLTPREGVESGPVSWELDG